MPAASYREGPDGHSSRKQNSKRRRAKCSPSFVSGRVIGHGDISPRCIPECSAMALHRAVPAARPSRASTLSFVLLAGAFSKSCLRCRFFAGRAAVIWCGANPGVRPWQDLRECALGRLVVAIFSRDAFPGARRWQNVREMRSPGVRQWQDCALMRSWPDWQRQYSATVRSRASIRGNFFASCIPKAASDGENRQFVARFARHASENGLALARYARHASEMPRKSPSEDTPREDLARKGPFPLHRPLESCTARRSCHDSACARPCEQKSRGAGYRKCTSYCGRRPHHRGCTRLR